MDPEVFLEGFVGFLEGIMDLEVLLEVLAGSLEGTWDRLLNRCFYFEALFKILLVPFVLLHFALKGL